MKKVMISQPMRGLTTEQVLENRKAVIRDLESKGYKIIDSVIRNYPNVENKQVPIFYLGESIKYLSQADILFMMDGWDEARGCAIEHEIAIKYGVEVQYETQPEEKPKNNRKKKEE